MNEGTQEVELNATNLPSGVYLYSIEVTTADNNTYQSNNFYAVIKMLLLK